MSSVFTQTSTRSEKKMSKLEVKYPDVHVQLVGMDGNAFAILGRVNAALRRAGVSQEEREQYIKESQSGDYDNLLSTAMRWVDCSGGDDPDA